MYPLYLLYTTHVRKFSFYSLLRAMICYSLDSQSIIFSTSLSSCIVDCPRINPSPPRRARHVVAVPPEWV